MNPQNPIILCVDDEEANLKLLEKILVPRGYAVVSAASGKDALLKIKSQTIDLVLLDIIMPEMDGFEVCRQIKEDQKLRNIPVIMITALTAKQDRIRGIEAGAEEFLSKPFDQTEVLARIKILLKVKELNDDRKRAEEALQKSHDELDCRVQERTAELAQANEMLQADIIERKQAEAALKTISIHQEALLYSISDLILETNTNKVYTWANPAGIEFFGKDVIGKEASFYFHREQNTYEVVEPLFHGDERVLYVESWQRRRDGAKRLLAWWSRVLKDGSGNVIGTVSSPAKSPSASGPRKK